MKKWSGGRPAGVLLLLCVVFRCRSYGNSCLFVSVFFIFFFLLFCGMKLKRFPGCAQGLLPNYCLWVDCWRHSIRFLRVPMKKGSSCLFCSISIFLRMQTAT